MCISIMQMKVSQGVALSTCIDEIPTSSLDGFQVENRYMAALQMIDEEHDAYLAGEDQTANPSEAEKGGLPKNEHLQPGADT